MKTSLYTSVVLLGFLSLPAFSGTSTRVLSLEDCLEIAIKSSTTVGIYREQFRTARNDILQQYGNFLPRSTLSMYAGHTFIGPTRSISIDPQGRFIQQSGFDYESYSFAIQATMTVFDWGVSTKRLGQYKQSAEAAKYDLEYQKNYVTAQVIRAYYDLLRKKNLKDVRKESMEAAERSLEQVEAFYNIGSKTKADVLQAKVRLANTQLALVSARNAEEIARTTLASLLNFPMGADFDIDASLDIKMVTPDLEEEVHYMLSHRPDLKARRKKVESTRSALGAAQNNRWPALSAFFRYGWNDRKFAENANFFRDEYSWNIGVSLDFNIFDGFATKSNIMRAKAQQRIAEYQLQQAKLDAVLEARQLYLALREAGERISLSEGTVEQAEENLRLAEERYRVGAGTILETIEAGVSLTEAQSSLIEAKCDYLIAKADLLRATGREVKTD